MRPSLWHQLLEHNTWSDEYPWQAQAKSVASQSYPIVLGRSVVAKVTLAQLQSEVFQPLQLVQPGHSLLNEGHDSGQGHRQRLH